MIIRIVLACLIFALAAQCCPAEPNTPEYAAQMAYDGWKRLDFDTYAAHACLNGEEREQLRRHFEAQARERTLQMDMNATDINYDFSQMRYTLLEQDAELARVRIEGTYNMITPLGIETGAETGVVLLERRDGVWKMCGEQDLAQLPLAEYRTRVADRENGLELDPDAPTPEQVIQAFAEATYLFDADAMEQTVCRAMIASGLSELVRQARNDVESGPIPWEEVQHDFSKLHYELVDQTERTAEVRLYGIYTRTHPDMEDEVVEEDQVFSLIVEDGRWRFCDR